MDIFCIAERQDREEDERNERHSDSKSAAFPEYNCRAYLQDDIKHYVYIRNQEEDKPPYRFAAHFQPYNQVVDRHDCSPTGCPALLNRIHIDAIVMPITPNPSITNKKIKNPIESK